ncbi:hypothetical protein H4219_005429 [Mycoemilia scoparia]|uniref:Peptidase S1 domain-containing protein n=1 Tax=Mycoemilia scoparia TaxID=417184 RepID=A0A9W7ZTY7_9FUNG|nr:hypothetical protein H4219_005429 [Mycoemilia scoparia]
MIPLSVIVALYLCIVATFGSVAGIPHNSPSLKKRIVNGSNTSPNQYPFVVRLTTTFNPGNGVVTICGGSIIAKNIVITAGHCVQAPDASSPVGPSQIKVGAGSNNADGMREYNVKQVIIHPNYRQEMYKLSADVAILVLDGDLQYSESVNQISIHNGNPPLDTKYTTVGYGMMGPNGQISSALLQADFHISSQPNKYCTTLYKEYTGPNPNVLCVEYNGSGSDFCNGDSGGPLFIQSGGSYQLVGLNSFGVATGSSPSAQTKREIVLSKRSKLNKRLCGQSGTVDAFTNLNHYKDFISNAVQSNPPTGNVAVNGSHKNVAASFIKDQGVLIQGLFSGKHKDQLQKSSETARKSLTGVCYKNPPGLRETRFHANGIDCEEQDFISILENYIGDDSRREVFVNGNSMTVGHLQDINQKIGQKARFDYNIQLDIESEPRQFYVIPCSG